MTHDKLEKWPTIYFIISPNTMTKIMFQLYQSNEHFTDLPH